MKFLFKKSFSWVELTCIIVVGALISASMWWLLLAFPVAILTAIGESYCEENK